MERKCDALKGRSDGEGDVINVMVTSLHLISVLSCREKNSSFTSNKIYVFNKLCLQNVLEILNASEFLENRNKRFLHEL